MEVEGTTEMEALLESTASGNYVDPKQWPSLRSMILGKLEKIVHNDFPIPKLRPPVPYRNPHAAAARFISPMPSSSPPEPNSQEADKENAHDARQNHLVQGSSHQEDNQTASADSSQLPVQLSDMLTTIKSHISSFPSHPPHTVQRLAELVLKPTAHYRALASYLHAVDRVVQVTSGTDLYGLPPPLPPPFSTDKMSDGDHNSDERDAVTWGQNANHVGSDEALGGALLTMIPWLARSPEGAGSENALVVPSNGGNAGVQMNSESTESIDGPNGVGSVETVSVTIGGSSATGHVNGVTQGELLRQEQKAGVVPVSQLHRPLESSPSLASSPIVTQKATAAGNAADEEGGAGGVDQPPEEDDDEMPHLRGPEEIGMSDTGPQSRTMSYMGDDGIDMKGLNVEAAVGRKAEDDGKKKGAKQRRKKKKGKKQNTVLRKKEPSEDGEEAGGKKREAEQILEQHVPKKVKEEDDDDEEDDDGGDRDDEGDNSGDDDQVDSGDKGAKKSDDGEVHRVAKEEEEDVQMEAG